MRNTHDPDTAQALIDSGLLLGVACPVCRHRALFDLHLIKHDSWPVLQLPFRCSGCGESKTFRYVFGDGQDIKDFEAGQHPRSTNDHHTMWNRRAGHRPACESNVLWALAAEFEGRVLDYSSARPGLAHAGHTLIQMELREVSVTASRR